MKENIDDLLQKVKLLENNFDNDTIEKETVLELLAKLKRFQDDPINESYNDLVEDNISIVITIVGQLN